jgi:hypothetical protein
VAVTAPAAAQEPAAPPPPPLRRWFEIDFAQIAARYRVIETSDGRVTNNHVQHRQQFRARVKADARGRYALHTGVFTGTSFISSWNNTGLGTGDPVTNLRLKQLFASAMPIEGVQGQVGGLYVIRGESTEITTYDEDAFIVGERVQVTRPADLWLDEIAFTNAELSHVGQPSITHRWHGFSHPNYRHLLVRKRVGRVAASADVTSLEGSRTLRAAAAATFPAGTLRVEGYRRMRALPAGGFAVTLERPVTTWLRAAGGYASVDLGYGGLNADRFDRGRRVFATTTVTFTPWLNVGLFATRAFASDVVLSNRTRFDAVLTYNLLHSLRRTGIF